MKTEQYHFYLTNPMFLLLRMLFLQLYYELLSLIALLGCVQTCLPAEGNLIEAGQAWLELRRRQIELRRLRAQNSHYPVALVRYGEEGRGPGRSGCSGRLQCGGRVDVVAVLTPKTIVRILEIIKGKKY